MKLPYRAARQTAWHRARLSAASPSANHQPLPSALQGQLTSASLPPSCLTDCIKHLRAWTSGATSVPDLRSPSCALTHAVAAAERIIPLHLLIRRVPSHSRMIALSASAAATSCWRTSSVHNRLPSVLALGDPPSIEQTVGSVSPRYRIQPFFILFTTRGMLRSASVVNGMLDEEYTNRFNTTD